MEEHLRRLLVAYVVEGYDANRLLNVDGPLSTYSSRIRLCEAIGLIAPDEAGDLNIVKNIGNDFAHGLDHDMSFDDESIRTRVFKMTGPRLILDFPEYWAGFKVADQFRDCRSNPRSYFEVTMATLVYTLQTRTAAIDRRIAPKSFITTLQTHAGDKPVVWYPYGDEDAP